jgi:hypothetical protein
MNGNKWKLTASKTHTDAMQFQNSHEYQPCPVKRTIKDGCPGPVKKGYRDMT